MIERRLTKPVMHEWIPQQVNLKESLIPAFGIDEPALLECVETYFSHIEMNLDQEEFALMHMYPLEVAINGAPGVTYVDAIKKSTSMGYPWKTSKRNYLVPAEDPDHPDWMKFTPEINERIEKRIESLLKGIRTHPIFSGNLKDKPCIVTGKDRKSVV